MFRLLRRGATWWYRGTVRGQEIFRSTKCRDKKAAELFIRRLERELADPSHAAAHKATVATAAARFMSELRREGKAAGTVNMYECKVGHVVRILGDVRLYDLMHSHVAAFVEKREEETAHPHTIHRELTALRRTLKSAARAGEFPRDPKGIIPRYSARYEPRTRWLTEDELQAVMAHLDPARAAVVAFAVATASDLGSLERARRADIGPDFVIVRGTKTDARRRTIPRVSIFAALLAFAEMHADGEGELLFQPWGNMRRDIARACNRAGIPAFTSNDLRRTAATWLVKRGVPLNVAAKFMGHSSTAMLQRVYGQLDAADVGRLIEERTARPVHGTEVDSTKTTDVGDSETTGETQ